MKPETEHIIQILRSAMRVLGFNNRDVEKKMNVSGGYLSRLFNGSMELRFEHIVEIAGVIGLTIEEVFQLAYPQPRNPPTAAAQRIRSSAEAPVLGAARPPAAHKPEPAQAQDDAGMVALFEQQMERMMMKMVRKMFAEMMTKAAGE
jgi:transcriptional regulator with XRE-family HTH domain